MKNNIARLLTALAIVGLLYGSLELNAMRTGWWNSTRNTMRTWWNTPYVKEGVRPLGKLTAATSGLEFYTDMASERSRRFEKARWQGMSQAEAWEEANKPGFINLGLKGRQRKKTAERKKLIKEQQAQQHYEKFNEKYGEFIKGHLND